MTDKAPVYGLLAVLQSGINNQPVDTTAYEATRQSISQSSQTNESLRRVLTGPHATREEARALRHVIENARDLVNLTQDSSAITDNRRDAAIAAINILFSAGSTHGAYHQEAAKLLQRANPNLFGDDPFGQGAVAVYAIATVLQTQKRMMQAATWGIMGLKREVEGLSSGTGQALEEVNRLQKQVDDVNNAAGQGAAERFFQKHTRDEENNG